LLVLIILLPLRNICCILHVERIFRNTICRTNGIPYLPPCQYAKSHEYQQGNKSSLHHQSNSSRIRLRSSSEWKGISMLPLSLLAATLNFTRVANFVAS